MTVKNISLENFKENVTAFASGKKAASSGKSRGQPVPTDYMGIGLQGSKTNRQKAVDALDVLSESKLARTLIASAAKQGYEITFSKEDTEGGAGFCDPAAMEYILSPEASVPSLVLLLAHESEHARHMQKTEVLDGERLNAQTRIFLNCSKEAAAYSTEAVVAYQLKDKYPDVWKKEMEDSGIVASAIKETMDKNPDDISGALETGFKAWFKDRSHVDAYTQESVDQMDGFVGEDSKGLFSKAVAPERILKMTCGAGKNVYMTGGDDMSKPPYNVLSDEVFKNLETVMKKYAKETGDIIDPSIYNFCILTGKDGKTVSAKPVVPAVKAAAQRNR